jgi:hypothetical protein
VTGWELLVVAVAVAAALAHTDTDTGTDGEVSGPLPPRLCLRTEEPTTRSSTWERSES